MNTRKTKTRLGIVSGLLAFALSVTAVERTIPTPPPSDNVDTESAVNVPLPDWPDLGRRVRIDLTAYATPSNAVQIAFGQDENGDENLEPEETSLVIGVDCGEPFVRDEGGMVKGWRSGVVEIETPSSTSTSNLNLVAFTFRQPVAQTDRFTHAMVTTWGREDTTAQIAAEITKPRYRPLREVMRNHGLHRFHGFGAGKREGGSGFPAACAKSAPWATFKMVDRAVL